MSSVPGQPGQPAASGQPVPATQPTQPGQPGTPAPYNATGGAPPPAQPGTAPPGYQPKTPWTAYIKPVIWTVVALYVIVFVFLNRASISINFVFFETEVPLIFVLVGMTLIGAGLAAGVMVMTRRRSAKKAELAAARAKAAPTTKAK